MKFKYLLFVLSIGFFVGLKPAATSTESGSNLRSEPISPSNYETYRSKSAYTILGLTPEAGEAEIKGAYRKLAKTLHPDRNLDNKEAADEAFKILGSAYDAIKETGISRNQEIQKYNSETPGRMPYFTPTHVAAAQAAAKDTGKSARDYKNPFSTFFEWLEAGSARRARSQQEQDRYIAESPYGKMKAALEERKAEGTATENDLAWFDRRFKMQNALDILYTTNLENLTKNDPEKFGRNQALPIAGTIILQNNTNERLMITCKYANPLAEQSDTREFNALNMAYDELYLYPNERINLGPAHAILPFMVIRVDNHLANRLKYGSLEKPILLEMPAPTAIEGQAVFTINESTIPPRYFYVQGHIELPQDRLNNALEQSATQDLFFLRNDSTFVLEITYGTHGGARQTVTARWGERVPLRGISAPEITIKTISGIGASQRLAIGEYLYSERQFNIGRLPLQDRVVGSSQDTGSFGPAYEIVVPALNWDVYIQPTNASQGSPQPSSSRDY